MNRICAVFCDSMGNVVKFNHLAEVLPDRREIVSGRADCIIRRDVARLAQNSLAGPGSCDTVELRG